MILIGENIHIISKQIREALLTRNEDFIKNLANSQSQMDYIDLNIGPAKGQMENIFPWLVNLIGSNVRYSFDTTNISEMTKGLNSIASNDCFINSISFDEPKMTDLINLALEKDCKLIALTLSKETGIPKTADGRLEIAFNIYEKALEMGFEPSNLYFDPLILPICVDQSQASEALNTIKMIKESFDPPVKTVVGLSNVSNGCPPHLRPLINKVFAVMAFGAGLSSAIINAHEKDLINVLKMLETNSPQNELDELYLKLSNTIENFGTLSDIDYNKSDENQTLIIKTAAVLLNKKVYSNSFTQI